MDEPTDSQRIATDEPNAAIECPKTDRLPVPDLVNPVFNHRKQTPINKQLESSLDSGSPPILEPNADFAPDLIDFLPRPTEAQLSSAIQTISINKPTQPEFVVPEQRNWQERLESANSDRKVLARFFAVCLCFVAIVNMVPALYQWYHWSQLSESMALPRWIYILVFVGAIHLMYAIFLFQINDWSAMRSVSIAMLAIAFVFGFISTGLLLGGGQSNLTAFLGIPFSLNRQACIWCVAMLCLATLMSFWGGKESANWHRAEELLKDIMAKAPV